MEILFKVYQEYMYKRMGGGAKANAYPIKLAVEFEYILRGSKTTLIIH